MTDFPAVVELADLDGETGFRLDGLQAGDLNGRSVASAGDVNGDGFDDVIVGSPSADANGVDSGASYVVFGKAGGFGAAIDLSKLNGKTGFVLNGEEAGDLNGRSVAAAGDVNGDGFDDLIVGAPDGAGFGSSYVVFGKTNFRAEVDLAGLAGKRGFQINGEALGDQSGVTVASAGDVNGDGFDDVVVGSPLADEHGVNAGASYVIFGKAGGYEATLNLAALDRADGFELIGERRLNENSGFSVASAGDVNGDGYDDLIVGSSSGNRGASYVVFGREDGFKANIELAKLNGKNGFQIGEISSPDSAGFSVASAGDVNGDGFDDVIIGSPSAAAPGSFFGHAHVVFGRAGGFKADLDLSALDGSNGFEIRGATGQHRLGFSVSSAGDVNGDGFDDVIVGSTGALGDINFRSGVSYVVFGRRDGNGFDPVLDISSLNGDNGFRIDGVQRGDSSGVSVSAAGDVNNDGFADIIVGSANADPNGADSGASYVIFGHAAEEAVKLVGSGIGQTIRGGDFGDRISGKGGADTLFGGGGADRFIFAPGSGKDAIRDFRDDGGQEDDLIVVKAFGFDAVSDVGMTAEGDDLVLDFGSGDRLRIEGYLAAHTIADIADDIVI